MRALEFILFVDGIVTACFLCMFSLRLDLIHHDIQTLKTVEQLVRDYHAKHEIYLYSPSAPSSSSSTKPSLRPPEPAHKVIFQAAANLRNPLTSALPVPFLAPAQ